MMARTITYRGPGGLFLMSHDEEAGTLTDRTGYVWQGRFLEPVKVGDSATFFGNGGSVTFGPVVAVSFVPTCSGCGKSWGVIEAGYGHSETCPVMGPPPAEAYVS